MSTPMPDLAPTLPSRIVKGRSTEITERGPIKGGTITFSLTQAILSVPDKTYLEASSVEVPLDAHADGTWEVRLPTVGSDVEPRDSWTITVKYSTRPYPFEIRVPVGTTPIDIADIGEVHGVAPEHAGWVVTGMQIGTVTSGTSAGARITGQAPTLTLDLTLPKGDKGDKGDTGPANSLTVGTVTTGPAGSQASVAITGTAPAQKLSVTVPRGDKGDKGDRGDVGAGLTIMGQKTATSDLPATGTLGDGYLIGTDLHVWNGTAWVNVGPVRGPQGEVGKTPQIAAVASALPAGAAPTVIVGGTLENPALTFGIPAGATGATPQITATAASLAAGATPTVDVSGPAASPKLAFGIPQGPKGDTGATGGGIKNVTQPAPDKMGVEWAASDGTTSSTQLTLPSGMTGFAEAESGIYIPTNVPSGSPVPRVMQVYPEGYLGPTVDKLDAYAEHSLVPRRFGDALQAQNDTGVGVVWSGSSTAAGGYPSTVSRQLVNRVAAYLGPRATTTTVDTAQATPATGVQVWQYSVGGTDSSNYLTDEKVAAIGAIKPVLMVHMVGSNDYAAQTGPTVFRQRIEGWLTKIRAVSPNTLHAFISHQARNDIARTPTYRWWDYATELWKLVAADPTHVAFFDLGRRWYKMGIPGGNHWNLVMSDNMHLADEGNRVLADWIAEWLGIPTPQGFRTYIEQGNFTGGNPASGADIATIPIPAAPFPRQGTVTATVYAATTGTADVNIKVASGSNSRLFALSMRIAGTDLRSYSASAKISLDPYVTDTVRLEAAPYSAGNLSISSNSSFSRMLVDMQPI